MTSKDIEFQDFINKITEIKNDNYEEFVRLRYLVDGVLLSKKNSNESSQRICKN